MNEGILRAIIEDTGLTRKEIREYILGKKREIEGITEFGACLLYTSPSPRDRQRSRMPSSA